MAEYQNFISPGTVSYLTQQFPEHAEKWLLSLPEQIHLLAEKWQLVYTGHEQNSRFGTILYASSRMYGDVAVKIVPWFSPRLKSEILCYRLLPYREMCPLMDVDTELGAMLLKFVSPSAFENTPLPVTVFSSLFSQKRAYAGEEGLPHYENVLSEVLINAENTVHASGDENLSVFLPSIQKALSAIKTFDKDQKYIIHGDAHEYNMLMSESGCVLIDPLGYIAPFEFEYARYLGTAMKHTEYPTDEFLSLAKKLLPDGADMKKCLTAFAIDVTLRASNTFIEGNTYEEICFGGHWARRAWEYLQTP